MNETIDGPGALQDDQRDGEHTARAARPRGEERDALLRASLEPLGVERPLALRIATGVALLLALGVIVGALTDGNLAAKGGSLPAAVFLAVVFTLLARGMHERRYWAVLGFEALLAFQVIVTSLALVLASTIEAAAYCTVTIGLGGWLFWKLIRIMGRIQAGERAGAPQP